MAGCGTAVLDALAFNTNGRAVEELAVESGNGDLGHIGLGKFDEGHSADGVRVGAGVAANVDVDGALDEVDLKDLAGIGKDLLQVRLRGDGWQIADENRTTVAFAGSQERLVPILTGGSAVLLQVEGGDSVDGVVAKGLWSY